MKNNMKNEDWSAWRNYKSNKDVWIESQERLSSEHTENCNGCSLCEPEIGFASEQRLREEVAELVTDEVIYSHKTLTDREIRDENIKLSL